LVILVSGLIADILIFSFVEYGVKNPDYVGCYAYDSMLVGFQCSGFPTSQAIELWLNWPLWLVYGPLFAFFDIKVAALTIIVWLPIVLYTVATLKLKSKNA
jgi:hypothetical protein